VPVLVLIWFLGVNSSSVSSAAVSVIIWNIVAIRFDELAIIAFTSEVFGINAIGDFLLYVGFVNGIPFISQNRLYDFAIFVLYGSLHGLFVGSSVMLFLTFAVAMYALTFSVSNTSTFWANAFRSLCVVVTVFGLFPWFSW
jgi:hypothetical protein